jgi:hypothetical protein
MFSLPVTLASAAVGLGLTVLFGWRGAKPPDLRRGPRMVPWRFLMLLAALWVVLMVVHLVNLMGVETGRR